MIDDRFSLSAWLRLVLQIGISVLAVSVLSVYDIAESAYVFIFFVIFISGSANFYNFMDGINGIAGVSGLIAFANVAVFVYPIDRGLCLLSCCICLSCIGFLPFNFPRARVFMGDVGSVFLGFVFACFTVRLSSDLNTFLCISMFLSTFYGDAIVTIFHRLTKGDNLIKAHRRHLYQYLTNELSLPHWKITLLYALVQTVFSVLSLSAYNRGLSYQAALFLVFSAMFVTAYMVIKKINGSR
ncbi:glycosyl transferase family protein [Candidatus Magnetoovum chiemensis]|nr:glycosyl transferase family protein [Candidatus Magnetoovum chiemensis]